VLDEDSSTMAVGQANTVQEQLLTK
jgi:hypothetical protein